MDSARLAFRSGPHAVIFDLRTDTFFDTFSGVKRELLGYLRLVESSCGALLKPTQLRNYSNANTFDSFCYKIQIIVEKFGNLYVINLRYYTPSAAVPVAVEIPVRLGLYDQIRRKKAASVQKLSNTGYDEEVPLELNAFLEGGSVPGRWS
jgi:hypothetical protein